MAASSSLWWDPAGTFDNRTGEAHRLTPDYVTDFKSLSWTPDGQIMVLACRCAASLENSSRQAADAGHPKAIHKSEKRLYALSGVAIRFFSSGRRYPSLRNSSTLKPIWARIL
jgi:hypothetical protein